jgi:hypothetical protein
VFNPIVGGVALAPGIVLLMVDLMQLCRRSGCRGYNAELVEAMNADHRQQGSLKNRLKCGRMMVVTLDESDK